MTARLAALAAVLVATMVASGAAGTPSTDHPVATVEGWGAGPCVEDELAVTVDGRLGCVHLDVLRDPLTG